MARLNSLRPPRAAGVVALLLTLLAGAPADVFAQSAAPTPVEQRALTGDSFGSGTLTPADGAVAPTLWQEASVRSLVTLLERAPRRPSYPTVGRAMRLLLLSPGASPVGATSELGGLKLRALAAIGMGDAARTIASLSGESNSVALAEALAVADLLDGDYAALCARRGGGRDPTFWLKVRVVCAVHAGDFDVADLSLGLLRERAGLSAEDEQWLGAAVAKTRLRSPAAPGDAVQLAAARLSGSPIDPKGLAHAEAGVLRAISIASDFPPAVRVAAAVEAASAGVLDAGELRAIFGSINLGDAAKPGAAIVQPGDAMADVAMFQAVRRLTAPGALRDKGAMIGAALAIADTFPRANAAALLYAEDLRMLDGILVAPGDAARYAVARLAVGDVTGATKWLTTVLDGAEPAPSQTDMLAIQDAVALLAIADGKAAETVARRWGIPSSTARAGPATPSAPGDPALQAEIVAGVLEGTRLGSRGQTGLAALAAASEARHGDAIARAVLVNGLALAGLELAAAQVAYEIQWADHFDSVAPTVVPAAPSVTGSNSPAAEPVRRAQVQNAQSSTPASAAPAASTPTVQVNPTPVVLPPKLKPTPR